MASDKLSPEVHDLIVASANRGVTSLTTLAARGGIWPRTLRRWLNEYAEDDEADEKYAALKDSLAKAIAGVNADLEEQIAGDARQDSRLAVRRLESTLPDEWDRTFVREQRREGTQVNVSGPVTVVVIPTDQGDPKKLFGRREN